MQWQDINILSELTLHGEKCGKSATILMHLPVQFIANRFCLIDCINRHEGFISYKKRMVFPYYECKVCLHSLLLVLYSKLQDSTLHSFLLVISHEKNSYQNKLFVKNLAA